MLSSACLTAREEALGTQRGVRLERARIPLTLSAMLPDSSTVRHLKNLQRLPTIPLYSSVIRVANFSVINETELDELL